MKGQRIIYSDAELQWLLANCNLPARGYHRQFVSTFNRRDVSIDNVKSLRWRKGWLTGRSGRFEKGTIPINKGVVCPPGKGGRHPNAQRTQFRKGERNGVAVRLYKPIGTERVSKDGYLERKIHDGMPLQSRWRAVHLIRWEAVHGPLPAGHCLKNLSGDRSNTDPSNWELISRGVLARLNGGPHRRRLAYDDASSEVRPALLALARVQHQAQDLRRKKGSAAG